MSGTVRRKECAGLGELGTRGGGVVGFGGMGGGLVGLGGMGGGLVDSREEWGEEVVGLGELAPGALLSVDGPDVTNKILPTFFPPFFCRDGVLI